MANPNTFFNKKDILTLVGVVASVVLPKLFFDVEEEVFEHTVEVDVPAEKDEDGTATEVIEEVVIENE